MALAIKISRSGDGIVSGGVVSARETPNMTVAVAAGSSSIGGNTVAIGAGNLIITTADGTHPRIDLVVINSSGTKSVTAGTPAASPDRPSTPSNSIILAVVNVPASDTTIENNQLSDPEIAAYMLQTTSLKIQHTRSPIVVPMPGTSPILFDLGQWKLSITVSGTTQFTGHNENDGSVPIADRDDLELIADPTSTTPWYNKTITITDDTNSGSTEYTVKIAGLTLEKQDVRDYYSFTLSMVGYLN